MKLKQLANSTIKTVVFPLGDIFFEANQSSELIGLRAGWAGLKTSYLFMDNMLGREAKDFITEVHENSKELGLILLQSPEFKQALQITIEQLTRTRTKYKRKIIKNIYLGGYLHAKDRERFELERMQNTVAALSYDSILHLLFIEKEIIPIWHTRAKKEIPVRAKPNREWWFRRNLQREKISTAVQDYIYQNYNINSPKIKATAPDPNKDRKGWSEWSMVKGDVENEVSNRFLERASELITLGVCRNTNEGGYTFTEYGLRFLSFVKV